MFKELSVEKKIIIEEMEFGALIHILELKVSHKFSRELIRCFIVYYEFLDSLYKKIYITPLKIRDALGINFGKDRFFEKIKYNKLNEEQKEIIDNFKGATLASLTKSVIDMSVEEKETP
ncbi:hypothetical protein AHAS_Ahas03G0139300 [Arachis hypogaea]|uniref:Uncharacterized protein n=1 Tax=Arachis hypogaea TaxID=3818 RepID=A0A445DZY1_ARAHY|nr:hypothetical protein Ahy_A03g015180 [Arachis hypogaea]